MIKIATVTTDAGAAANITFSSIPGNYTDLVLVMSLRSTGGTTSDPIYINFNGDNATNYGYQTVSGSGGGVSGGVTSPASQIHAGWSTGSTSPASVFGNAQIWIGNYAGSTAKICLCESAQNNGGNSATGSAAMTVGSWSGTSAVTSIVITTGSASSLAQYSSATLYGILKGTSGGTTVA